MQKVKLKGGSLSATYLCGDPTFVRKEVSLTQSREYGFVRWSSQLKKMQRFSSKHPELFPKILDVGVEEDTAFFSIEYMKDFKDIKTLFTNYNLPNAVIEKMHSKLWASFDSIHSQQLVSTPGCLKLYFKEEVEQKLFDACKVNEFAKFIRNESFTYNDEDVLHIFSWIGKLKDYLANASLSSEENILGNPTLENILYSIVDDRIVFIDLYEESIADTKLLDYAQILQCSSSMYGYINDRRVIVEGTNISHSLIIPPSFAIFNALFEQELIKRELDLKLIKVLEATQFIRMLPFKLLAGEIDKAKFFYVHACKLLQDIFDNG